MASFVKIDTAILQSSLWPEKPQRDVFLTALFMAEPFELREPAKQIHVRSLEYTGWIVPVGWYGLIRGAGPGIIHHSGLEKEEGLTALEKLGSPDPDSRSQRFEGRRLVRIDGGYLALNYIEYRERDYSAAERSKRWRERKKKEETIRAAGTKPRKKPEEFLSGDVTRCPVPAHLQDSHEL